MVWFGRKLNICEKMPNFQRLVWPTGHHFFANVFSPLRQVSIADWGDQIKFLYSLVLGVKTADLKSAIFSICSTHRWRPLVAMVMKQVNSGLMSRPILPFKAIDFLHSLKRYGIICIFAWHILKRTKMNQFYLSWNFFINNWWIQYYQHRRTSSYDNFNFLSHMCNLGSIKCVLVYARQIHK